ncbi:MAG: helix-turn-helix transcriptional regulator [Candidatus Aminicenantes bacterium]|nr:helix-turn-helix transcriptional regulator [Candidatus Aminicenantes bacterium]
MTEGDELPDDSWPACLSDKVFRELSARERACLVLWANEGFTAREIAGVLGLSPGTVRVHLFQARRKLKKLMERGNEKKV